jgi:hypothetical protein
MSKVTPTEVEPCYDFPYTHGDAVESRRHEMKLQLKQELTEILAA